MSDQINDFDQIFRDKLSDHTATPPPAVWENIQSTRTFGHVVANRISNNWRIFGTLLMLLLAGGSSLILFGEEEAKYNERLTGLQQSYSLLQSSENKQQILTEGKSALATFTSYTEEVNLATYEDMQPKGDITLNPNLNATSYNSEAISIAEAKTTTNAIAEESVTFVEEDYSSIPSPEVLVSLEQAGFVRPNLLGNKLLSVYIETLEGWGDAKPKGFVRYDNMESISTLGVDGPDLSSQPKKAFIDYDYVSSNVERKTFKERTSFILAFTPHMIHKSLRAEYNLSSSFLEDRKKAESTRLAYTISGLINYELKKHKFIETGINYTQIYEEMSYEGKSRFSNEYNFLEIPVLLGYEDRNAKWGWHIKGGLGVQVYNTYKGYTLKRIDEFGAEEEEPLYRKSAVQKFVESDHRLTNNQARNEVVDLEEEGENPYKTSGVINMHFATGITYYHSIKTSFLLTPSYRRSINSISKESAKFSEKISYTGVSFAARFKF